MVTLAAFLGLQGVLLKLIGEGGTIAIRDRVLLALNNDNMPVWLGWTLYVLVVGGYAATVAAPGGVPAGRRPAVRGAVRAGRQDRRAGRDCSAW